jgi:aryl-alcohol dehydrogenase-like predicted oxidoreductase
VRYRALGDSDLIVSVVGLGGNNFGRRCDKEQTRVVVEAALDAGVTSFDTADIYGDGDSERFLGAALEGRRDQVLVATKFGGDMQGRGGGSREHILTAVEASLERLQTDWIDLYQYHFPDGVTPIGETLTALDELVRQGKVRHIGSSNFSAAQVEEAEELSRRDGLARFISAQNHYSLLERDIEPDLVPVCERHGIGILPYFPLAHGLLTGKYRRGEPAPEGTRLEERDDRLTDEAFDRVEALERYAEERGRSLLEVAIGGLAAQPAVGSVIAGATAPEQVRANAEAGEWVPSAGDLAALDEVVPSPRPS